MTFLMHWSFKTGYHEIAAKKFLATGAPFPECKSWKRFHGPGSVEGWILVEADSADACYEHAAEWAECLDWEVTPVLSDEQAGPIMAKVYNWNSSVPKGALFSTIASKRHLWQKLSPQAHQSELDFFHDHRQK